MNGRILSPLPGLHGIDSYTRIIGHIFCTARILPGIHMFLHTIRLILCTAGILPGIHIILRIIRHILCTDSIMLCIHSLHRHVCSAAIPGLIIQIVRHGADRQLFLRRQAVIPLQPRYRLRRQIAPAVPLIQITYLTVICLFLRIC